MEIAKTLLYVPAVLVLVLGFLTGASLGAGTLQGDSPGRPFRNPGKTAPRCKGLFDGHGLKEVLLLADPFCENSRKIYQAIAAEPREQIKTLMILWVSVYPPRRDRRLRPPLR